MRFLKRHRRPVQNRHQNRAHHQVLRPGPAQKIRSKAIKRQPHNRKRARLYHGYRMQKRRNRRRSHARLRKPRVKRAYRGLYAKPEKAEHINQQKQIPALGKLSRIHHAAQKKIRSLPIGNHKNHPDKRKRRPADGIIQILAARKNRLPGQRMHHQRQRHQRQHLIKAIHRQKIIRQRNPKRHPVRKRIKHKKRLFMFFLRHIFKRIQRRKRPQKGNQPCKHRTQPVQLKRNRQISGKIYKRKFLKGPMQQKHPDQNRIKRHKPL